MTARSEARRLRLTTLGRPIDLRAPTNLAILVLSLLAGLAGIGLDLSRGAAWDSALLEGLRWGGACFLSWALARETDPDRWASAFFAAVGGLAGAVLLGPPSFLFLLWFLIALRYINRSTGVAPGILDFGALYGIKLWLGFSAHWTIPLLTFPTVFFGDIQRFPRSLRVALPLALPTAAVILGLTRGWHFAIPEWGLGELLGLLAIVAALVPVLADYRTVRSVGDRTGEPLKPHRVRWAVGWSAAAALILTLGGTASVQELAPIWAALAASSIGWMIEKLVARRPAP